MSVATQVTDLTDLRTDLLARLYEATGITATNNIADRLINIALHDIHLDPGNNFPWAVRRAQILTHARYTTGTVDITAAARTTVTGTSTLWNTAVTGMGFNNARVGGKMTFSGSPNVFEVSAVGSDTSITIADRWVDTALDDATYTYFEDEYALAADFWRLTDLRSFSDDMKIMTIGPQEFRRQFSRNSRTGRPLKATVIQLGFSSTTTPRYRVVFAPAPDIVYQIPYAYITTNLAVSSAGVEQTQLTAATDEPIIPLRYRHILVLHALYNWYRDRHDDTRSGEAKAEYVELMQRMTGDSHTAMDNPRFIPNTFPKQRRRSRFAVGNGIIDGNGNVGD